MHATKLKAISFPKSVPWITWFLLTQSSIAIHLIWLFLFFYSSLIFSSNWWELLLLAPIERSNNKGSSLPTCKMNHSLKWCYHLHPSPSPTLAFSSYSILPFFREKKVVFLEEIEKWLDSAKLKFWFFIFLFKLRLSNRVSRLQNLSFDFSLNMTFLKSFSGGILHSSLKLKKLSI